MPWDYEIEADALRTLAKLDKQAQAAIIRYLDERIIGEENPRRFGHALKHGFAGLWRWRVGDYRIIGEIRENKLVVLVVKIGHRSKIYN